MLPLLLLSLALTYAVFQKGGVWPKDWSVFLLALTLISAFFWLRARRTQLAPPLERSLRWPLLLLPGYAAFQLLPLPLPLLRLFSPARAELHDALARQLPSPSFAPLTVVPAATLEHFVRIAGCLLAFFLLRQLAFRLADHPWALVFPLLAIAALEAALGLAQFYTKGSEGYARGTFVNRNHYAGFLEMSLPFAVMYPIGLLRRNPSRHHSPARPALLACAFFALAALILLGVIHSLSRMGFISALFALFVCGTGILACVFPMPRLRLPRFTFTIAVAVLVLAAFIFLPPDQLIARFGDLAATDDISGDTRVQIWKESLHLIAAFPLFGCGLGGYHSAFLKYKQVAPTQTVDFAHNDYLQSLAELGALGFAIAAALILAVLAKARRAATAHTHPQGQALAIACLAALAAILLHSLADFNLYIPANAMLLTWIAATGVSLMFSSRPLPGWRPAPRENPTRLPTFDS